MITIETNMNGVVASMTQKLNSVNLFDQMLRTIATNTLAAMKQRIHKDGKDSSDNAIGTYSDGYMAVRTGVFKTNDVYKSGKNKGKQKPVGVFTKGKDKGEPRPRYNRTADTKVIISLTRQMENDMTIIPTEKGYGIGYLNSDNADKVGYVEHTYMKDIFGLTEDEKQIAIDTATEFVKDKLNGKD